MGVKGLWNLLEPVGRRVNIEAIANKRLAIDASIWLFQFMKAMRDDRGDMMRNAHLLGFFRRICRLLFHRVRPVFVFDGATPALKRHTNIARRRRREAQQGVLRKTAEKLLIAQLKKQALQAAKAQQQAQGRQAANKAAAGGPRRPLHQPNAAAGPAAVDVAAAAAAAAVAATGAAARGPARGVGRGAASGKVTAGAGNAPEGVSGAGVSISGSGAGPSGSSHPGGGGDGSGRWGGGGEAVDVEDEAVMRRLEKGKTPMTRAEEEAWLARKTARERQQPPVVAAGAAVPAASRVDEGHYGDDEEMMEADEALARELDRELNGPHPSLPQQQSQPAGGVGGSGKSAPVRYAGGGGFSGGSREAGVVASTGAYGSAKDWAVSESDAAAIAAALAEDPDVDEGLDAELLDPTAGMRYDPNADEYVPSDHRRPVGAAVAAAARHAAAPRGGSGGSGGGTLGAVPAATPGGGVDDVEEEGEDDDADADLAASMLALPDDLSSIDPAVLSTLPTSLQLDILEKLRDAQMAANRERFQVAARVRPESFCEVQMATYLKASAFRQQLEEYKQILGGGGQGTDGAQVRKIMSEEGREFILARESEKPDKQRQQRGGGGLFGGGGDSGGGGRRGGGNKHDQLAVAAAAASAARRNAGTQPKLAAVIPLAAFKGFSTAAAGAPAASANSTAPAPPATVAAAALDKHGPMDANRGDSQPMEGTVARGAVLELNLSDAETGSSGSAGGMFGSSSSDDDAEGARAGGAPRVTANMVSIGSGAAAAVPSVGVPAGASSSAPSLDDVEWEDVEMEAAAPSVAAATVARTNARPRDWRERMAARQKLWSTSHGFRMGRKLADWGSADDAEQRTPEGGGAGGGDGVSHGSSGQRRRKGQVRGGVRRSGSGGGGGADDGEVHKAAASAGEGEEDCYYEEEEDASLQEAIRQSLQQQQQQQEQQEQKTEKPNLQEEGAAKELGAGSRKREAGGSAPRASFTAAEKAAEVVAVEAAAGSKPRVNQPSRGSQPPAPAAQLTTGCLSDEDFEWEDVNAAPEPKPEPAANNKASTATATATATAAISTGAAFVPPQLPPTHGSPSKAARISRFVRHLATNPADGSGNHQPLVPRRGPLAAAMARATGQLSGGGSGGAAAATMTPPSDVYRMTSDAAVGPAAGVTAANPDAGPGVAAAPLQREASSDSVSDGDVIWEAADADVEALAEAMPAVPDGDVRRCSAGAVGAVAAAAKHAPGIASSPAECKPCPVGVASAREIWSSVNASSPRHVGLLARYRQSATATATATVAATAAEPVATDVATQQTADGKAEPSHPAVAAGTGQQRGAGGGPGSSAATAAVAATARCSSSLISQINSSSTRRLLELSSGGGGAGCVAAAAISGAAKAAPLAGAGSGARGGVATGFGDDDDDDDDVGDGEFDVDFSFVMKPQGAANVPWVSGVPTAPSTVAAPAAEALIAAAAAATSPEAVGTGNSAGGAAVAAAAVAATATVGDTEASDDFDIDFSFVAEAPGAVATVSRIGSEPAAVVAPATDTQHTDAPIAATTPAVAVAVAVAATATATAVAATIAAASHAPIANADASEDFDFDFDFDFVKVPPVAQPPPSVLPAAVPANVTSDSKTHGSSVPSAPGPRGFLDGYQPHDQRLEDPVRQQQQQELQQEPAAAPAPAGASAVPSSSFSRQVLCSGAGALGDVDEDVDAGEEAADDADWFDEDPDYVPDRDRHPAGGQVSQPPAATAATAAAAATMMTTATATARMVPPGKPPSQPFQSNTAAAATASRQAPAEIPYGAFLPPPLPPGTWIAPMPAAMPKPHPMPSPPPPLPPGPYGTAVAAAVAAGTAPPSESGTAAGGGGGGGGAAAAEGPSLDELLEEVEAEEQELKSAQARASRNLEAPTPEMYQECQELLQMFGLPFIVAPMEAEAQCAYLELAGLVDGVVTDDNDVFLFGGRHVYRHIFENKKYVEEYKMDDVERELGLTRERLAEMALLLGSDYTEGCSGIGIVNAVEVVQAFPGQAGLERFRTWVESPDVGILVAARQLAGEEAGEGDVQPDDTAAQREFKRHHRAVRKNWQLPASFPSPSVLEAYLQPRLDPNKTRFSFGRPDIELLRQFCSDNFGWTPDKVDELLVPVLKEYDNRQAQLRMEQFLSFSTRFAKIRSKRLQNAVAGIRGQELGEELVLGDTIQLTPSRRKRSGGAASTAAAAAAAAAPGNGDGTGEGKEGKVDAGTLGAGAAEDVVAAAAAGEQGGGGVRGRNGRGGVKRARTAAGAAGAEGGAAGDW